MGAGASLERRAPTSTRRAALGRDCERLRGLCIGGKGERLPNEDRLSLSKYVSMLCEADMFMALDDLSEDEDPSLDPSDLGLPPMFEELPPMFSPWGGFVVV